VEGAKAITAKGVGKLRAFREGLPAEHLEAVLVLAGDLAAVAPVADGRVEDEDLHRVSPSLSTQASNLSP
jgi:hypothetical protein